MPSYTVIGVVDADGDWQRVAHTVYALTAKYAEQLAQRVHPTLIVAGVTYGAPHLADVEEGRRSTREAESGEEVGDR